METCAGGVRINGKTIRFPCYFASISSVKTHFPPSEYADFLIEIGYPYLLVSAYDFIHAKKEGEERTDIFSFPPPRERDNIIILDSGNYESYWLRDRNWNREKYFEALDKINADVFLSFDYRWGNDNDEDVKTDYTGVEPSNIIPIVHGSPDSMAQQIVDISRKENPIIIALPERELGDGVIQIARTIMGIKETLEKEHQYPILHLLGTGNPISILIYTYCGISSFDSLDWCTSVIHPDNLQPFVYSHLELIDCICDGCIADESYSRKALLHNIIQYSVWMNRIREHLENETILELLKKNIPKKAFEALTE